METSKPGLASAPVLINSSAAQTEKRMDVRAPLMAVYIPAVPAVPAQPPTPVREPGTLHLAVPPLYSMETLPFLTLHIAGGLQSPAGLSLAAVSPSARMRSAGKHVCPHCGRDCLKPSVLEKHLRCHTGERPYPCTTCGISFKTQSNLYKHKRTQAHARVSSETDQSCLGSLESMSSSRDTCTSSLSVEESGSMENDTVTPPAPETAPPANTAKVFFVQKHDSEPNSADHKPKEPNESNEVTMEGEKQRMDTKKMQTNAGRHLPLQRQEATLFSKQWESSVSRGKSQSHESTDSGFSESSDHHPSPGSILLDHSMDSLTESTKEHLEEADGTQTSSEPGQCGQEPQQTAKEQEQKSLEERISKLISENTAVVEDKQLENVRPRKTVLSKQGSIDLPMPYTYKDSFHFDIRTSHAQNVGLQRARMAAFCSSVPTQHSTTTDHAPLIRSNSLPFSVSALQPERSTTIASSQSDYLTLIRRRSSGNITPTSFTSKSVNQQSSTHRPLVRQIAVDCNHATDGLCNSSVEESCAAGLGCDRDNSDSGGEPRNRKFRRKKAQKFAYNKWYMYGDGTFKKLYSAEKDGEDSVAKGKKSLTNPDQEVPGLQKRLSEVPKETLAVTGTGGSFTNPGVRLSHPEGPLAIPSHVSMDFNRNTGHTPTSFSSLLPLRRNLSLSVLPLPLIGSLVDHKTGSLSRAEDRRLINDKHTDSSSQLCVTNIPSDRKKQKTEDKTFLPLENDSHTHPPPPGTGGEPQQTSNPSHANLQDNRKHTHPKGIIFSPSIINANTTPISTSTAPPTPSSAKTSFLPKYQLKLPNASEHAQNSLPQLEGKSEATACITSSASSTSCPEPNSASSLMQSCFVISSTQSQLPPACTATTPCQPQSSSLGDDAKSSQAAAHWKLTTATITTTCLKDCSAGLCSTSVQLSKSTGDSEATQLAPPPAPVGADPAPSPTISTGNDQTSAATIRPFSHGHQNHPLAQLSPSPVNRPRPSPNTSIVPCQIVPFDQMQPAAQNVFHVHTADLQICLQIISDEQLALIEPQIERQASAPEALQKHAQSLVAMGTHNEVKDLQHSEHQKESLVTLNKEQMKPQRSEQIGKSNLQLNKQSSFTSADSKASETQRVSQEPHNYLNVNVVTETPNESTNVVDSLKSEKAGRNQHSGERHTVSMKCCVEEQLLPDSRVSQSGFVSQTLSGQRRLGVARLSSSMVNQNSLGRNTMENQSQDESQCNERTTKSEGGPPPQNVSRSETHPSPLDQPGQNPSVHGDLSGSVPPHAFDDYKAPGQTDPQATVHCRKPVENASSKQAPFDSVRPVSDSQEITPGVPGDKFSSAPSGTELDGLTSVSSSIQRDGRAIPAAPTDTQTRPSAVQKEPQQRDHGGTAGPPDNRNQGPLQKHKPGDATHRCMESGGDRRLAGDDKNRRAKTNEELGWRSKVESGCRYSCLQDETKPQGEERLVKTDSLKSPWILQQHLSTACCGMHEPPRQSLEQAAGTAASLSSTTPSGHMTPSSPPRPSPETNVSYVAQRLESSAASDQQPQRTCDSSSGRHIGTHLAQMQNTFSQINSRLQRASTTHDQHAITSLDAKPTPSSIPGRVPSAPVGGDASGVIWDHQASSSTMLDSNTLLPPYLEAAGYQDIQDQAPNEGGGQRTDFGRNDIGNKYQSFFFSGLFHGYPPGECLTAGLRPVQTCQDYREDTSSSDDEGKLIIEL